MPPNLIPPFDEDVICTAVDNRLKRDMYYSIDESTANKLDNFTHISLNSSQSVPGLRYLHSDYCIYDNQFLAQIDVLNRWCGMVYCSQMCRYSRILILAFEIALRGIYALVTNIDRINNILGNGQCQSLIRPPILL